MLREERRDDLREERAKEEMLDQLTEDQNVFYTTDKGHKMMFYSQASQQEFSSDTSEVIAFLKASWEEIFPLSVEEKIKATEEPLTRQERVFVGVDHKTVEEEQEENCLTFVKRGKTSEVKVGKSYENYNLISITIIHNS